MKRRLHWLLLAAALTLTSYGPSIAAASSLSISDPWIAATPKGASTAAGYLTITNNSGSDDRLIGATMARAQSVQIHEMTMDGGIMRMRQIDGIRIPAHGSETLEPGGYHLMLLSIQGPFVAGEKVDVTLDFERAGKVDTVFEVRNRDGQSQMNMGPSMEMDHGE